MTNAIPTSYALLPADTATAVYAHHDTDTDNVAGTWHTRDGSTLAPDSPPTATVELAGVLYGRFETTPT